jgi:hypothetical protein
MAIKPQDMILNCSGLVQDIERQIDAHVTKTRDLSGVVSFVGDSGKNILQYEAVRKDVQLELANRYRASGWNIVDFSISYKAESDFRGDSWTDIRIKYHLESPKPISDTSFGRFEERR